MENILVSLVFLNSSKILSFTISLPIYIIAPAVLKYRFKKQNSKLIFIILKNIHVNIDTNMLIIKNNTF